MDSTSIDLKGARIALIELNQGCLSIHLAYATLVKTLTGSTETTRWWQAGVLQIDGAVLLSPLPVGSCLCTGGDIDDNIYTYRDMIPIPMESRGRIRCELHLEDSPEPFIATGSTLRLEMQGIPKYIEHLRPSEMA